MATCTKCNAVHDATVCPECGWSDEPDRGYVGSTRVMRELTDSGRLPVRADVTECTYHRNPTPSEIKFGYGATHYRTFDVQEVCFPGTRIAKRWFVADDGLRYYR